MSRIVVTIAGSHFHRGNVILAKIIRDHLTGLGLSKLIKFNVVDDKSNVPWDIGELKELEKVLTEIQINEEDNHVSYNDLGPVSNSAVKPESTTEPDKDLSLSIEEVQQCRTQLLMANVDVPESEIANWSRSQLNLVVAWASEQTDRIAFGSDPTGSDAHFIPKPKFLEGFGLREINGYVIAYHGKVGMAGTCDVDTTYLKIKSNRANQKGNRSASINEATVFYDFQSAVEAQNKYCIAENYKQADAKVVKIVERGNGDRILTSNR